MSATPDNPFRIGTTTAADPRTLEELATFDTAPSPEVIEGLVRQKQIVAVGGTYGLGKSPWLQELLVCRVHGLRWCGRQVEKGPAVLLDFENHGGTIRRNIENACLRYGVAIPRIPEELELFTETDDPTTNPATAALLEALSGNSKKKAQFLQGIVDRKPNALIVIDPPEMFFRMNTREGAHVLIVYAAYRILLGGSAGASIVNTFNLRKRDKQSKRDDPDLLTDPRSWLEEICGSLNLLNRSDVRLGMDFYSSDGIRVVNGVRRGEEMHPLLIRPVMLDDDPDKPAGFELVPADDVDLVLALPTKLHEYWLALPQEFTFAQATAIMSKSNFHRLKKRATSMGALEHLGSGSYRKTIGGRR